MLIIIYCKSIIYTFYNYLYLISEQLFAYLMFYPVGIPSAILIILLLIFAFFIYLKEFIFFVNIAEYFCEYFAEDLFEVLLFLSENIKFIGNALNVVLYYCYNCVYSLTLYIVVYKIKYFAFRGVVLYFIFSYM